MDRRNFFGGLVAALAAFLGWKPKRDVVSMSLGGAETYGGLPVPAKFEDALMKRPLVDGEYRMYRQIGLARPTGNRDTKSVRIKRTACDGTVTYHAIPERKSA